VKTKNEGKPMMTPNDLLQQFIPYIEGLREQGNAISTTTVILELLRMAPNLLNVGFVLLNCQVLHFLKKHHNTFCVVTRKAKQPKASIGCALYYWGFIKKNLKGVHGTCLC
jgi:hypothetical protein